MASAICLVTARTAMFQTYRIHRKTEAHPSILAKTWPALQFLLL